VSGNCGCWSTKAKNAVRNGKIPKALERAKDHQRFEAQNVFEIGREGDNPRTRTMENKKKLSL